MIAAAVEPVGLKANWTASVEERGVGTRKRGPVEVVSDDKFLEDDGDWSRYSLSFSNPNQS